MSSTGVDTATVRENYARAARSVTSGKAASCCGPTCCGGSVSEALGTDVNPITSNLYGSDQTATLPEEALLASLGCGNPTALATLHAGEVVLTGSLVKTIWLNAGDKVTMELSGLGAVHAAFS